MLTQRLIEGTLDLAVLYPDPCSPRVMSSSIYSTRSVVLAPRRRRGDGSGDYVFIDWCPEFQQDHASAYPELASPGLGFDLGDSTSTTC